MQSKKDLLRDYTLKAIKFGKREEPCFTQTCRGGVAEKPVMGKRGVLWGGFVATSREEEGTPIPDKSGGEGEKPLPGQGGTPWVSVRKQFGERQTHQKH